MYNNDSPLTLGEGECHALGHPLYNLYQLKHGSFWYVNQEQECDSPGVIKQGCQNQGSTLDYWRSFRQLNCGI